MTSPQTTLPAELIEEAKKRIEIHEEWLYPNSDIIEEICIEFIGKAYHQGLKDEEGEAI